MNVKAKQCFFFLFCVLSSNGVTTADERASGGKESTPLRPKIFSSEIHPKLGPFSAATEERDVVTPTVTVPTYGTPYLIPNNPYTTPTPVTNPETPTTTTTPATGATPSVSGGAGQSWCVATPTAASTALQVALDYACGFGDADCSAIQPGASCFSPDTVRDHASYAFNSYYQKNPIPTSCDFGGTAAITNTDPSTPACLFPSTSTGTGMGTGMGTGTATPGTTNPTDFGSAPPSSGSDTIASVKALLIFMACLANSLTQTSADVAGRAVTLPTWAHVSICFNRIYILQNMQYRDRRIKNRIQQTFILNNQK